MSVDSDYTILQLEAIEWGQWARRTGPFRRLRVSWTSFVKRRRRSGEGRVGKEDSLPDTPRGLGDRG